MELPAVHLSVDDLERIEKLMKENTDNGRIELILSFPGGVEQKLSSVDQINSSFLTNLDGSISYSLSVVGEEGKCTVAGESVGTESHMLYGVGDPDWKVQIRNEVREYINSIQTTRSYLRGQLRGVGADGVTMLATLFIGWAISSITPQPIIHYFPTLLDAFVFFIGAFGLLIVRYRNWVHPYIRVGYQRAHPTKRRASILCIVAFVSTLVLLMLRLMVEPGPFLR